MAAGSYNLSIEQGATFDLTITWKNPGGSIRDLTGYTAKLHMRQRVGDATPTVVMTTENGRIALGGTAGTINLHLTAAETMALTWASGVYDLVLSIGPDAYRLLKGQVMVSPAVTK